MRKQPIIIKLGGSIIDSTEGFIKAAKIIKKVIQKKPVIIVISAMKGVTDQLTNYAKLSTKGKISAESLIEILSMGERTSAKIFAATLESESIKTRVFDPTNQDWPIITTDVIDNAEPLLEETRGRCLATLLPLLEDGIVPIVCGFLGKNQKKQITSLGRGGSDTTAVILGNVLDAEEVILVKDVEGILSGDPKQISKPKSLKEINSNELLTLSTGGSRIIHSKALKWKPNQMAIRVVKFDSPNILEKGTTIIGKSIKSLSIYLVSTNITMVTIVGNLVKLKALGGVFNELDKIESKLLGVSVDRDSITAYFHGDIKNEDIQKIHDKTMDLGGIAVSRFDGLAMLAIVGKELETTPYIIDRITSPLKKSNINLFGLFTTNSQIKVFVSRDKAEETSKLLEEEFKKKD
ncbi:MAG: amino acid kinase family protein [Candidatus Ranarchaeia archaeon]